MVFSVDFSKHSRSKMDSISIATTYPQHHRYGLHAIPRDVKTILPITKIPEAFLVHDLPFPKPSPLCTKVLSFAEKELSKEIYNHSMRVYYFAQAIMSNQWPEWTLLLNDETLLICCLLHDLGTTEKNLQATALSYEFYGALLGREFLLSREPSPEAPREQVDSITEAILRHQDLECVEKGNITVLGMLLQLATLLDNTGRYHEMVHEETIRTVVSKYPRLGWSNSFCGIVEKECRTKRWSFVTKLGKEEFVSMVKGNIVMNKYEREEGEGQTKAESEGVKLQEVTGVVIL